MIERHGRFNVVREDLVPGGTKQIVLREYLPELKNRHFVYAASTYGKGGAAVAYACAELGFEATLFMAPGNTPVKWVEEVEKLGIKIHWTRLQQIADIDDIARGFAFENEAAHLPLGFMDKRFTELMAQYASGLPFQPNEIWCPVVSGTMASALEIAFPDAAIKGVSVVKHPGYQGRGELLYAEEKFVRNAASPPPYPSWTYSDAKVWRLAQKFGKDDAVIWNSNA